MVGRWVRGPPLEWWRRHPQFSRRRAVRFRQLGWRPLGTAWLAECYGACSALTEISVAAGGVLHERLYLASGGTSRGVLAGDGLVCGVLAGGSIACSFLSGGILRDLWRSLLRLVGDSVRDGWGNGEDVCGSGPKCCKSPGGCPLSIQPGSR